MSDIEPKAQSEPNAEPMWLPRAKAARRHGYEPTTFNRMASDGTGAPYILRNGRAFYRVDLLDIWAAEHGKEVDLAARRARRAAQQAEAR